MEQIEISRWTKYGQSILTFPSCCSCGVHAIVCSHFWLIIALPLFFLQGPCGCGERSQSRGFPDLPAGLEGAERRAWVTTNSHTSAISRQPRPLQLPTQLSCRVQHLQQKPSGEIWFQQRQTRTALLSHYWVLTKLGFLHFLRVTSKLYQTQRLATGKSTNTSSSTLYALLPPWRRSSLGRCPATRHLPPQTEWCIHPSHPQRRGLEKCLVRLIGNFHEHTLIPSWIVTIEGQISNHWLVLIRQGQDSCYEGSGRAPPLGPHPSVLHPTVPSTHKEGIGQTNVLLPQFKMVAF